LRARHLVWRLARHLVWRLARHLVGHLARHLGRRPRRRIAPYLPVTPLRRYAALDEAVGFRILVKHENHLPNNAVKVRNTLSFMTALPADQRARGVIAASRGNHGLGLAWSGEPGRDPAARSRIASLRVRAGRDRGHRGGGPT
jgi:hypothetical protein